MKHFSDEATPLIRTYLNEDDGKKEGEEIYIVECFDICAIILKKFSVL